MMWGLTCNLVGAISTNWEHQWEIRQNVFYHEEHSEKHKWISESVGGFGSHVLLAGHAHFFENITFFLH